jgi:hypothetical protein
MLTILNSLFGVQVAHAAASKVSPVVTFVGKVNRLIINPLITLMFAAALVFFLYGVLGFLLAGGSPEAREKGQKDVINGLIGMFIMFSVYAILGVIQKTLGVSGVNPNL